MKKVRFIFAVKFLLFLHLLNPAFSNNPNLSNYLVNLSGGPNGTDFNDRIPEIAVSGNTVHILWVQEVSNNEAHLYYRRSANLGDTWGDKILVKILKDRGKAVSASNKRLAVDGENVHIGVADYDYSDKGTGRIFYFRSTNGGVSFSGEQVLSSTAGGYTALHNSFIAVKGNKVFITYQGEGTKKGTRALYSANGGGSFSDNLISDETTYVSDLYFDGSQMIVVSGYAYYQYGLHTGKVWVSVSSDGTSFKTSKVSVPFSTEYGERERGQCTHSYHYSPKIARSGDNIHVVFAGYGADGVFTNFYTRSTNSGVSFAAATDINKGITSIGGHGHKETIISKNGYVYIAYLNGSSSLYFLRSDDNGNSFSTPGKIFQDGIAHIAQTDLPGLHLDPKDNTGKTIHISGSWLFSAKSSDGGVTFSGAHILAPFLKSNIVGLGHNYMNSWMAFDENGGKHWVTSAKWRDGSFHDIFYRNVKSEPDPGAENKALKVEHLKPGRQSDLVVVPASEAINFDSAMTAELWVKIDRMEESKFNLLAKVNGTDGDAPTGYQLGITKNSQGAVFINAGLRTDKGAFVHTGTIDIRDDLWHHIAFTYDANSGLNNFKLYINGLLHKESTVTGSVVQNDGMLLIGARQMGSNTFYDAVYQLDNVRLWKRALSGEEILDNQAKKLSGQEEGLSLFLNFDDTFKDLTGKGNDGIPVYRGTLEKSGFDPPVSGFDLFQVAKEISFNNRTTNATSYLWNFGDGKTSQAANPKYSYTSPGEYQVSLLSMNSNSVTASVKSVTIAGLSHVEPARAGNHGFITVTAYGGGINADGSSLLLRKAGSGEIVGRAPYSPAPGQLSAQFLLNNATVGKWDVVVKRNNAEIILNEAFTIEQATLPDPWVSLAGRGAVLLNMWQTYTINYGNNGNIDALGVPLNLVVSDIPGLDIEFIDFSIEPNQYIKQNFAELLAIMDTLYFVVDDYFGPGRHARFYPLYIPVVEARSTQSIRIRIKTPDDFSLECWTTEPFIYTDGGGAKSALIAMDDWPDEKTKLNACIALSAMHAASSVVSDMLGMVLPVDCIYDIGTYLFNPWDAAKPKYQERKTLYSSLYSISSVVLSCASDLSPIKAFKIGGKLLSIMNNMYAGYKAHQDCLNAFDPRYKNRKNVKAVTSFDPNEMVGPAGFGQQNWIQKSSSVPYTILFENLSSATAPAHIVTIIDTLDLSVFDISDFGFGSFGWQDTVFNPPGNKLKEFSVDIDMRPGVDLITRVSAKLDTVKGIIRWEFLSLNPVTLDLEEDPFIGFLPPNSVSPEGEGFVSFFVGLREELGTDSEIRNQASIVFDANKPIITNEYLNTLDLDKPESRVLPLESTTKDYFTVSWTGSDKGSGIGAYSVYVLENDTLLWPWKLRTAETSAVFPGNVGSSYKFYSIAIDNVSLMEKSTGEYDAFTTVTVNVEEFEMKRAHLMVYPNPVTDRLNLSFPNAPFGAYVVEIRSITGQVHFSEIHDDYTLSNGLSINVKGLTRGQYIVRVIYGNRSVTRKILVN